VINRHSAGSANTVAMAASGAAAETGDSGPCGAGVIWMLFLADIVADGLELVGETGCDLACRRRFLLPRFLALKFDCLLTFDDSHY